MVKRLGTDDQKLFQNYITTLRNLSDAEADFVIENFFSQTEFEFKRFFSPTALRQHDDLLPASVPAAPRRPRDG